MPLTNERARIEVKAQEGGFLHQSVSFSKALLVDQQFLVPFSVSSWLNLLAD